MIRRQFHYTRSRRVRKASDQVSADGMYSDVDRMMKTLNDLWKTVSFYQEIGVESGAKRTKNAFAVAADKISDVLDALNDAKKAVDFESDLIDEESEQVETW